MYKVKKGKKGVVRLMKPRMVINLENATQEQLKVLYEIKHPFISKGKDE